MFGLSQSISVCCVLVGTATLFNYCMLTISEFYCANTFCCCGFISFISSRNRWIVKIVPKTFSTEFIILSFFLSLLRVFLFYWCQWGRVKTFPAARRNHNCVKFPIFDFFLSFCIGRKGRRKKNQFTSRLYKSSSKKGLLNFRGKVLALPPPLSPLGRQRSVAVSAARCHKGTLLHTGLVVKKKRDILLFLTVLCPCAFLCETKPEWNNQKCRVFFRTTAS